jgi:hypothetical protein
LITGAATQVSFQGLSYFIFIGSPVMLEQVCRRHDHSGCAETTLQSMTLIKRFLEWVQFPVIRQSFNRSNLTAVSLNRKHRTTLGGFPIYMDGAGAAIARIAANVCAR